MFYIKLNASLRFLSRRDIFSGSALQKYYCWDIFLPNFLQIYYHTDGEIWQLHTSLLDATKLAICYNTIGRDNTCCMKTSILKLPTETSTDTIEELKAVTKFDTSAFGSDVKTTEFHPNDEGKASSVTENHVVLWDVTTEEAKSILTIQLEGKNSPKFTTGKWNPHQNCNQVLSSFLLYFPTA